MIAFGFLLSWTGYLEIVYGWCLLRGYDVTWRQLASPVHPYSWPSPGEPPKMPGDQIVPTGKGAGSHTEGTVSTAAPNHGPTLD